MPDFRERYATKVRSATDLSPNGMAGCLVWSGSTDRAGYGRAWDNGRLRPAHHVAWILGPSETDIQGDQQFDHLCRRRNCVNHEHLEIVTRLENVRRGDRAKLNLEQAVAIKRRRLAGELLRVLAEEFSVSESTVGHIAAGRTWADA